MRNDIFKNRIKKVRRILRPKRFDALILTVGANISYLSGFSSGDSWLILTAKDVYLITDSRYTLAAKKQCPPCRVYERKGSMIEAVVGLLKKLSAGKMVAVEDKIELSLFKILHRKLHIRLKSVKDLVESVRQIKDEFEVKATRKAAAVAQKTLVKVLRKIRIGASEIEVAAMLEFELKKAGASPAFETIVAFGSNSAMPHYRPTAKKLKKVDTILIDFGAKLNGYCCDLTRCFAVGKVNDFYRKVYRTVFNAQANAIKNLKAGVKAKKVDTAAKDIIKSSNLPVFGHGTGHGLGLEVHEQPVVSVKSKATLAQGNVITIEPAVYLPGRFGIRIEDDVLVTENGCKILSSPLRSDEVPLLKVE
jgi:Xaa-Pro aminopeptidase